MTTIPAEGAITTSEELATPAEEMTTPADKKSSKSLLIAGAVILGLLLVAAGTGAIVYYVNKKNDNNDDDNNDDDNNDDDNNDDDNNDDDNNDDDNNDDDNNDVIPLLMIDQETAAVAPNVTWPNCSGQIFVNSNAKELYSIDVRIYDKYSYGPVHVEIYDGLVGTTSYIAKSSTKTGQGWTSFEFPTHPILKIPDHTYSFIIVPENKQVVATWYNDNAGLEQGKRIVYDYTTHEYSEGPAGSSLTFRLLATPYNNDIPIDEDTPVLVFDEESAVDAPDVIWPECQAEIFVNQTIKTVYSIAVRVNEKKNYGPMHLELYDNEGVGGLIAKSSTETGQGWTTFNFTTRPKLIAPNYEYLFMVVPDNGQTVSIWFGGDVKTEEMVSTLTNYITKEVVRTYDGSSLTFKLYATEY